MAAVSQHAHRIRMSLLPLLLLLCIQSSSSSSDPAAAALVQSKATSLSSQLYIDSDQPNSIRFRPLLHLEPGLADAPDPRLFLASASLDTRPLYQGAPALIRLLTIEHEAKTQSNLVCRLLQPAGRPWSDTQVPTFAHTSCTRKLMYYAHKGFTYLSVLYTCETDIRTAQDVQWLEESQPYVTLVADEGQPVPFLLSWVHLSVVPLLDQYATSSNHKRRSLQQQKQQQQEEAAESAAGGGIDHNQTDCGCGTNGSGRGSSSCAGSSRQSSQRALLQQRRSLITSVKVTVPVDGDPITSLDKNSQQHSKQERLKAAADILKNLDNSSPLANSITTASPPPLSPKPPPNPSPPSTPLVIASPAPSPPQPPHLPRLKPTVRHLAPTLSPGAYANGEGDIAVCTPPIHHGDQASANIVEWSEAQRLLGVAKVVVYRLSPGPIASTITDWYQETGFFEVFDWVLSRRQLAQGSQCEEEFTSSWGLAHEGTEWANCLYSREAYRTHYFGQHLAINHCLYHTMAKYRWVGVFDFDEFLVPKLPNLQTWRQLFEAARRDDSLIAPSEKNPLVPSSPAGRPWPPGYMFSNTFVCSSCGNPFHGEKALKSNWAAIFSALQTSGCLPPPSPSTKDKPTKAVGSWSQCKLFSTLNTTLDVGPDPQVWDPATKKPGSQSPHLLPSDLLPRAQLFTLQWKTTRAALVSPPRIRSKLVVDPLSVVLSYVHEVNEHWSVDDPAASDGGKRQPGVGVPLVMLPTGTEVTHLQPTAALNYHMRSWDQLTNLQSTMLQLNVSHAGWEHDGADARSGWKDVVLPLQACDACEGDTNLVVDFTMANLLGPRLKKALATFRMG